ncbi:GNAT family N-acetyltransferase [Chitinophaga niabensis]|uniref:GNAT family N-acetyltransferase n=1 Tax=Chitinophaga niabensis TaxID=536979 RepID=UPI000940EF1D|nr:GNAT family N-acetyltransferase [Chitinophaga niabensis]
MPFIHYLRSFSRPSKARNLRLLRDYQRIGLGRKLAEHAARWLLQRGIDTMVLFGTPQNPTCYSYEALGGKKLYNSKGGFDGEYGWKDITVLIP